MIAENNGAKMLTLQSPRYVRLDETRRPLDNIQENENRTRDMAASFSKALSLLLDSF